MTQRSIMFHLWLISNGTTGWMLSTVRNPLSGPTPFSQLNWNGTLTRSETGFESFFASSWASPEPPWSLAMAAAGHATPSARTASTGARPRPGFLFPCKVLPPPAATARAAARATAAGAAVRGAGAARARLRVAVHAAAAAALRRRRPAAVVAPRLPAAGRLARDVAVAIGVDVVLALADAVRLVEPGVALHRARGIAVLVRALVVQVVVGRARRSTRPARAAGLAGATDAAHTACTSNAA